MIISLSFSGVALAAGTGELDSIKDSVVPNKENSVITTSIKGTTDAEGTLIFPVYKDTEITKVDVKKGKQIGEFKKEKSGSLEYYVAKFEGKSEKVEFVLTQNQKKTYAISDSKQKETFPGNVKTVTYKMVNTTPIEIKKYDLEMAIPPEYELYNIIGYDPELSYKIFTRDGMKLASFEFGKLTAGKDIKFALNLKQTGPTFTIILWGVILLVSAFFLYKNRGMLNQAKEIKAQKKAEA